MPPARPTGQLLAVAALLLAQLSCVLARDLMQAYPYGNNKTLLVASNAFVTQQSLNAMTSLPANLASGAAKIDPHSSARTPKQRVSTPVWTDCSNWRFVG